MNKFYGIIKFHVLATFQNYYTQFCSMKLIESTYYILPTLHTDTIEYIPLLCIALNLMALSRVRLFEYKYPPPLLILIFRFFSNSSS